MKYSLKNLMLFAVVILISTTLLSQTLNQNVFTIPVDPKHASTIIIDSEKELKVETWNENYILFQIEVKAHSESKEAMLFLEIHKKDIIHQEFTIHDFLHLTIPDLDKILQLNDCNSEQLFSYKIIAPKSLDLELRCKNDMVVNDDPEKNYPFNVENLKAHDDK